jgi:hypothetical protein
MRRKVSRHTRGNRNGSKPSITKTSATAVHITDSVMPPDPDLRSFS